MKKYLKHTKKFLGKHIKLILAVIFIMAIAGFSVFIYYFIFDNLPSPQNLKDYKIIPLSTHIYDRKGRLLYEIYRDQNRTPIRIKELPKYIAQATIAIEDKDYYRHKGIAPVS